MRRLLHGDPVRIWISVGLLALLSAGVWLFLIRGVGTPYELSGSVTDSDGRGISGVAVSVSDSHAGVVVGEALTDADGRYAIALGRPFFDVAIVDVTVGTSTVPSDLEIGSEHERCCVAVGRRGERVDFRFEEILTAVSSVIFDDSDMDGVQDVDEEGVASVSLVIEDPTGRATTIFSEEGGVWTANITTFGTHRLSLTQEIINGGMRVSDDLLPVSFEYTGDPISLPDIGVFYEEFPVVTAPDS